MDETDTMSLFRRRQPATKGRPDYRLKLERADPTARDTIDTPTVAPADSTYSLVIGSLSRHPEAEGVAFQAVVVGMLQMLSNIEHHECQAAEAALSLAQKEKLAHMADTVRATAQALREAIRSKGAHMLDLTPSAAPSAMKETAWWFALVEAMEVVEESLTWTKSLVAGRPRGSAVRTLGDVIARLLRAHHTALLEEAKYWLD